MKKTFLSIALTLSVCALPALGASVTLTPSDASPGIGSFFDVFVDMKDAFATPHDIAGNTFSGFGFDVNVSDPGILQYDGETIGSLFFDVSGGGTDVAGVSQDLGGIAASDFNLAVLHFTVTGIGNSLVEVIGANDPADNLGLVWTDPNDPGAALDTQLSVLTVAPEPSTWMLTIGAVAGLICIAGKPARRIRQA